MPTSPTVLRSSLVPAMQAIAARLVEQLPIDASRVKQVARPGGLVPNFDGDQDIVLRWLGWRGDKGHETRVDFRAYRKLEVILRTRNESDEAGLDVTFLEDPQGAVVYEESVLDILHGYWPRDASGNDLTLEPIVAVEGSAYDRGKPLPTGWGQSSVFFELLFNPPVTVGDGSNPT